MNAKKLIEEIRKNLPENPYPEDIFPATMDDYIEIIPDTKTRTAISGCLGRRFWNIAETMIVESIELTIKENLGE